MRRLFAVAMGSVVALAGFAGVANASATVDLIWIDMTDPACTDDGRRDCPHLGTTIGSVAVTDNITLGVIITAGPGGVVGGGVSVNYGDGLPTLSVVDFRSMTTTQPPYLPSGLGTTSNIPPYVNNINAVAMPFLDPPVGIGLPPGSSAYLGTVTFHRDVFVNGSFEISVGVDGPGNTDDIGNLDYDVISSTTTFNSAFLVNVMPGPTPTPTATPTAMPTAIPTATPEPTCADLWPVDSITTIGKSNSPSNNLKVSHFIVGNIVDPLSVCPVNGACTAQRIPVCAGTEVTIAVTGSTDNTNIGRGDILCGQVGCTVGAVTVMEKYKSVSADGKDTDRMTLLPQ